MRNPGSLALRCPAWQVTHVMAPSGHPHLVLPHMGSVPEQSRAPVAHGEDINICTLTHV